MRFRFSLGEGEVLRLELRHFPGRSLGLLRSRLKILDVGTGVQDLQAGSVRLFLS